MNKAFYVIILLCGIIVESIAQERPVTWGEVDTEDLEMTAYALDEDAEAVVLEDYGEAKITFVSGQVEVIYVYHKRIKILTDQGFDYADISIPYYNNIEGIKKVDAQTIVMENGTQKKYPVKEEDFFKDKVSDRVTHLKFTFPQVKEGAIIEYKYVMRSKAISVIDKWYFQGELPRRTSEFRFEIPDFLEYVMFAKKDMEFDLKDSKVTKINLGAMNKDHHGEKFRFRMKNVPAMKEEAFITTLDDYLASIEFQLAAFEPLDPSESRKEYMTTWENFHMSLMRREKFGSQLKEKFRSKQLVSLAKSAVEGTTDEVEMVKKVYSLITNKIKWDGRIGIYANENINTCLKNGKGNGAALNIGLINCLNEIGLEAYPVLISTRSHGAIAEVYPIESQFNHTIAYVKAGEKEFLIDAIDKNKPYALLPERDLNKKGLLLKDKEISWVGIKPRFYKSVYSVEVTLEEDVVAGKLTGMHEDYAAYRKRSRYLEKGEESYTNSLLEDNTDLSITSLSLEGLESPNEKLSETIEFEFEEAASSNVIYINPMLWLQKLDNPFKLKERNYNVDIPFPMSETFLFKLAIPEGYTVEELPEGTNQDLPGKGGSFVYQAKEVNGTIQLISKVYWKELIYEPKDYQALKAFYNTMIEKQAQQIVLKKIE